MSTYPLYVKGNELTKQRAVQTIDWIVKYSAPSGFFYGYVNLDGSVGDDSFHCDDQNKQIFAKQKGEEVTNDFAAMKDAHLIRKSGDMLAFLYKHFDVMPVKMRS